MSASERERPLILLIEDNPALADVYRERLSAEGYEVHHCLRGREAVKEAEDHRPDLILLDIMMPDISGFEVLDHLRNTPVTAATKIIILTGLPGAADREKASEMGADDYLVKSEGVVADLVAHVHRQLKDGPRGA